MLACLDEAWVTVSRSIDFSPVDVDGAELSRVSSQSPIQHVPVSLSVVLH